MTAIETNVSYVATASAVARFLDSKTSAGVAILFYCTTETVVVNFGTGGSCEGKYVDLKEDEKFDKRGVPKTDSEESDSSSKNRQV